MALAAANLDWNHVKQVLAASEGNGAAERSGQLWPPPLEGTLRVKAESFTHREYTWRPFHAEVLFSPEETIHVSITRADLCGISTPGTITTSPAGLQKSLTPSASNRELAPTLACLWNREGLMSGTFDLKGELSARGDIADLPESLQGNLHFTAKDGRIYRFGLLAKIFAFLNLTEIFRGRVPDLLQEGFAYNSIETDGKLQGGRLVMDEGTIDGASMNIAWQGNVDFVKNQIDMTVLVAPLKTVDTIIGRIPLLGDILGGNLVSIPVRVTGDLSDPTVTPLSPSAVGSELLGIMRRTLQLPFRLIEPVLPDWE
jgi:hypothetical protein